MHEEKQHEHKSFPAVVTGTDEVQGIVEAIVAVFGNVDDGEDIVFPGAFAKTLAERFNRVTVLDNHRTDSIMRVIGKPLEAREISRNELPPDILMRAPDATGGLWTKTQYLMDTPEGRGAFIRIASGAVKEYSFAYDVIQSDYVRAPDGRTQRHLKEIRLWEYSPVIWGMNSATATVGVKYEPPAPDEKAVAAARSLSLAPRDRAWDAAAADARVREWAEAGDAPNAKYRRAFLWYDAENPDLYGSYKLPFADVIDGELTAVFRGISAAAARLEQTDIPDADKSTIRDVINGYYAKARREYDDDSIVSPFEKEKALLDAIAELQARVKALEAKFAPAADAGRVDEPLEPQAGPGIPPTSRIETALRELALLLEIS